MSRNVCSIFALTCCDFRPDVWRASILTLTPVNSWLAPLVQRMTITYIYWTLMTLHSQFSQPCTGIRTRYGTLPPVLLISIGFSQLTLTMVRKLSARATTLSRAQALIMALDGALTASLWEKEPVDHLEQTMSPRTESSKDLTLLTTIPTKGLHK